MEEAIQSLASDNVNLDGKIEKKRAELERGSLFGYFVHADLLQGTSD